MPLTLSEETPPGFERVLSVKDPDAGLDAYIAIHSTALGPAAGGCRMWAYEHQEAAKADALRLAAGMTSKCALAGLPLGGGKSVIIADAKTQKTPDLLRAFGRAVDRLAGRYYTAEDVGISPDDMAIVAEETEYAVGLNGGAGDPSPFTAEGVFRCMEAGAEVTFGTGDLRGCRVLVQGLGHVGMGLAGWLHRAGAELIVTDIDPDLLARAKAEFGAEIIAPEAVFYTDMDIFAPCALGGILTESSAQKLTAKLVAGAANNQLATPLVADRLRARGIRYLPDYVVNAGGIIHVSADILKTDPAATRAKLDGLAQRMRDLLKASDRTGKSTLAVADGMVAEILKSARLGAA
ncbi:MAG: Glu/Leu/Phe/Val dehydrogenase dimerization domain-containing protein [Pseudomonadota bacterium]